VKYIPSLLLASAATLAFSSSLLADEGYFPTDPAPVESTNKFTLGIEGFRDHYRETSKGADVTDDTNYGSVTGSWMHFMPMLYQDKFVFGFDGRASYGTDDYHSASGTESGTPEYEFDGRLITGFQFGEFLADTPVQGTLLTYMGLGLRYYRYDGKGRFTSIGDFLYDRRITQSYVPIGLTYTYMTKNGFSIAPTFEYDPVIRGFVDSRLSNGGLQDVENTQHSGYGLRSDIMVGWTAGNITWQLGPFIRFWSFQNSNVAPVNFLPPGRGEEEPANNRVQYGVALKAGW
jgi:hypothetical protein